jgi:UPF0716 family protein affecting phage T7 exclusion
MGPIRHAIRLALGVFLVLLGIVGLILPIMPGWIFLIPGLLILGDYFPPIRRLVDWAKACFSEADEQFRKHRAARRNPLEADSAPDAEMDPAREGDPVVARRPANSQQ